MSTVLHIHLLDGFHPQHDGKWVGTPFSPGRQSLLAYLLLHRQPVTRRRQLAFLFWTNSSAAQAHTSLRQLIHRVNASTTRAVAAGCAPGAAIKIDLAQCVGAPQEQKPRLAGRHPPR